MRKGQHIPVEARTLLGLVIRQAKLLLQFFGGVRSAGCICGDRPECQQKAPLFLGKGIQKRSLDRGELPVLCQGDPVQGHQFFQRPGTLGLGSVLHAALHPQHRISGDICHLLNIVLLRFFHVRGQHGGGNRLQGQDQSQQRGGSLIEYSVSFHEETSVFLSFWQNNSQEAKWNVLTLGITSYSKSQGTIMVSSFFPLYTYVRSRRILESFLEIFSLSYSMPQIWLLENTFIPVRTYSG